MVHRHPVQEQRPHSFTTSSAATTQAGRGSGVFDFSGRMPSSANSGPLIQASEPSLEEILLRAGVSVDDEYFNKTIDELEAEGRLVYKEAKGGRRKKGSNKKGKRQRVRGTESQLQRSLTVPKNSEVRGLTNRGNVCFANAVLQCCMVIPEYRDLLLQSGSSAKLVRYYFMALTMDYFSGSGPRHTSLC